MNPYNDHQKTTKEEIHAFFTLARIPVVEIWELPNDYWPDEKSYEALRKNNPAWLVETYAGLIKINPRKRVVDLDWSKTPIRKELSTEPVTKSLSNIHCWNEGDFLKSLKVLGELIRSHTPEEYLAYRLVEAVNKAGISTELRVSIPEFNNKPVPENTTYKITINPC